MSQLTERAFTPSESLSSMSLFLSLAGGQWRPGKFWHRRSFRQKFLLRSLIMPRLSVEWMNELSHWPNLNTLLTRQPRLPVRLHRPYLAANLNRKQLLEALRYRKIHADYNAFWESVGGECDAERHYRLPGQIVRKEVAEIASKKRAEYRRRYEMLDAIQPQMATMFRG
ncbi:DUF535 family protein [Escherichia marmotae]|uniref:DUF535 family protein n=1 Tax=Escherichia marmotae TaxID=1499973 RepID=UPI0030D29150